jgi:hypothetical protein
MQPGGVRIVFGMKSNGFTPVRHISLRQLQY